MKRILRAAVIAAGLVASRSAQAQVVYTNDFTGGLNGFTTTGSTAIRTDNGVTYLGNMTQGSTARLTLNTSGFTNLKLAFTLYGVLSVDGNGPLGGAADPFLVSDNSGTIFNYTFANFTGGNTQSFGGTGLPPGAYAPRTGEAACGALGFGCGDFGDATYVFSNLVLTPGPGGSLTLTFTGNSNQGIGDEFYGIDDVRITGTQVAAVPEPATLALLASGLSGLGLVARRRRAAH